MTQFKTLEEKFICGTCKRKVHRFLIDGELIDSKYMKGIVFQVLSDYDDKPVCFGVTSATEDKFRIFNLGYWFEKCKEACLHLETAICYECRNEVAIWGYGREIDRRLIAQKSKEGNSERTGDKRKSTEGTDGLHRQREGSAGTAIRTPSSSEGPARIRSDDGTSGPVS